MLWNWFWQFSFIVLFFAASKIELGSYRMKNILRILSMVDLGKVWPKKWCFYYLKILSYSLIGDLRLLHNTLSLDRCSQLSYLRILVNNTFLWLSFQKASRHYLKENNSFWIWRYFAFRWRQIWRLSNSYVSLLITYFTIHVLWFQPSKDAEGST